MAGQNNHFLITIQVGLAAVENGTAQPPSGMRVAWAPHDRASSARRSREFANKALLAWLVDAIDAYVQALGHPPVVANADLKSSIARADNEKKGIAGRVQAVATATSQETSAEAALMRVAIVWRNRLVHSLADNKVSKSLAREACQHAVRFTDQYQGLLIDDLIDHVMHKPAAAPTLKEVTAIVRAAHKLIERADAFLLERLDLERYLRETLRAYLVGSDESTPGSIMVRASNVWAKSPERCRSSIIQIALNNGFTTDSDEVPNQLTVTAIGELINMSPSEAVRELVT